VKQIACHQTIWFGLFVLDFLIFTFWKPIWIS